MENSLKGKKAWPGVGFKSKKVFPVVPGLKPNSSPTPIILLVDTSYWNIVWKQPYNPIPNKNKYKSNLVHIKICLKIFLASSLFLSSGL